MLYHEETVKRIFTEKLMFFFFLKIKFRFPTSMLD